MSPVPPVARPRTVTWPATLAPAAGSLMFTVTASAPAVGQVLGMAATGAAAATADSPARAASSVYRRPRAARAAT